MTDGHALLSSCTRNSKWYLQVEFRLRTHTFQNFKQRLNIPLTVIHAGLNQLHMDWSNNGEILALGGFVRQPNLECRNFVKFYSSRGHLRYSIGRLI